MAYRVVSAVEAGTGVAVALERVTTLSARVS